MATFDVDGMDAMIRAITDIGEDLETKGPAAAMAGGEVAVKLMQARVPVRTGTLSNSLTIKGPFHTVADGYYVEVTPDGTRKSGKKRQRNATVGYVLEYGRSNMPARPWMRPALEDGAEEIAQAMADVIAE